MDLASCDYWIIPTLKKPIRGRYFDSHDEVVNTVHTFFNSLSQEDFKKTINVKWAERMEICVKLGPHDAWYIFVVRHV